MVTINFKKIDHPQWKYELEESHMMRMRNWPWFAVAFGSRYYSDYLSLAKDGYFAPILKINCGYRWDGCSGPTFDTPTNMRAGLVHDALYQLMRLGVLPQAARAQADREFLHIMKEDGMGWLRRTYYYWAVRLFARRHAKRI